jgi:LPXTG-motif cell wall-anchored protein
MAMREEYAPWDGKWIGYDWFKLLTALILLLLLIGAWLVFGGPPPRLPQLRAPVVSVPVAGATLSAGAVTFSGQATPGSTVRVVIDGVPVGTAIADGAGVWSLTATLDRAGQYQVVAEALRPDGTVAAQSVPQNLIVSAPAVAAPPLITSLRDGAQVTAGKLTLSGTGQPGSQVEIRDGDRVLGTETVGADGAWSFVYDASPGTLQLSARLAGDPASASAPLRVTVNPAVAAPPAQTGGTGTPTGGVDVPAALPRTGGASIPWGALAALAAAMLGSGVWMRRRQRR